MRGLIKPFIILSVVLLATSCVTLYNETEESIKEHAPSKVSEQWAADYYNQKFDTLYVVVADTNMLRKTLSNVVLYDKDLNKKFVVQGGTSSRGTFLFGLVVALVIVFIIAAVVSD